MRTRAIVATMVVATLIAATSAPAQTRTRADWIALAKGGFVVPPGRRRPACSSR